MSTTTHAQETTPQDEAPHGAPQAGGMSGVAAPPGEGALAREAARYRCDVCGNWYLKPRVQVSCTVAHAPGDCCHYGETTDNPAPAPSSPRAEAPEAEPEDAAALERDVKSVEAAFGWPTYDAAWEALDRLANRARAALRRAAPGAAPVTDSDVQRVTAQLLREGYTITPPIATPAPTGERAGGEAQGREDAERLRRFVLSHAAAGTLTRATLLASVDRLAPAEPMVTSDAGCFHRAEIAAFCYGENHRPAPVAAPRESVGCALCGRPRFQHFGRREHCFPEMLEGGKCWTPAPRGTEGRDDAK